MAQMRTAGLGVAGLFAGIGGFERGLARAGHVTKLLCEIDDAAVAVLAKKMPGIEPVRDVRKLETLPKDVQLVAAGFPCQDLSQVGRARGITGAKSRLIHEVFRLLRRHPVPWVVLENVPFFLRVKRGATARAVLNQITDLGYRWAYRIVDSRAFGVPQRRERVFIVATLDGDPRSVLLADDAGVPDRPALLRSASGFYWTEGNKGTGWAENAVPPLKGGSTFGIPSPPAILMPDGRLITPDIRDAERLQGFPCDWTKPALRVGGGRHRWRLVGNAVSVPVAEWIGRRLAAPRPYEHDDDELRTAGAPWPSAAWNLGDGVHVSNVSRWPVAKPAKRLHEFLEHPGAELTLGAASGFYNRLMASTLTVPPGLQRALEKHIARLERARDRRAA